MTFWTKAAAKQKAFLLRLEGEWERDGEMEEEGEGGGVGVHHLVQRSISFAWFILSKAPTMQMTHKAEIERLWSWCQLVNLYMIARQARCPKSFSIRWHFQYRVADLEILKLLLSYPPQSWKPASSSATPPSFSSPFIHVFLSSSLLAKVHVGRIF